MFGSNVRFKVTGGTVRPTLVGQASYRRTANTAGQRSQEIANFFSNGLFGSQGNSTMNMNASGPVSSIGMMTGLVPEQEDHLRKFYRDIYYYDAVSGAAVDLFSNFPFSDFSLTGCDEKRLEKYNESLNRINIRSLLPEISTGYLVEGSFVSSLIFNKQTKVFTDLILYPIDDCTVKGSQFYSADPIITVRNSEKLREFMHSSNKQAVAIRNQLPEQLRRVLAGSAFELDPLTTLYLARRTLPGSEPTSWLKRVLPAYLIEKTLYRGTLVEVNRRQRSMLHVQMGDDTHEFTPQEMAETVNQFQLADLDPLGAVIGTRNNVQASEIRQGGDFWKWTDQIDTLTPFKLRALGISEAFLSGDAAYSNVETALSVFMENADAYRSYLTYETFYNKVFPLVAIENDFFKPGKQVDTSNRSSATYQVNNAANLEIPVVRWHKKLDAKSEENLFDMLEKLEDKGLPIPLRMYAAAAKVDVESLMHDLQQDQSLKQRIAEITKGQVGKKVDMPDEEGSDFEFAGLKGLTGTGVTRRSLLSRDFGNSGEVKGKTKTGKDKAILNQKAANARVTAMIAKAVKTLEDPNAKQKALKKVASALGRVPNILNVPIER